MRLLTCTYIIFNLFLISDLLGLIYKCFELFVVGYLCPDKLTHWLLIISIHNIRILVTARYMPITVCAYVRSGWNFLICVIKNIYHFIYCMQQLRWYPKWPWNVIPTSLCEYAEYIPYGSTTRRHHLLSFSMLCIYFSGSTISEW